ncbi:MAG TPA: thiamine-phosphate kinase [Solirubrobacterales bacterium]
MGEFELLARIRELLPPPSSRVRLGSGDDASVTVPDGATATSVDALVEGVHFRREHATLAQIGRKALATALSDLAAMGAEPGEAYVVLGIPTDLDEDDCLELLRGMAALSAETGTALAGGDVTRAPALTLTTTVVGHAASPELMITRSGGSPGDALVLTGEIGAAAAGLLILEKPEAASGIPPETASSMRERQLDPRPRLEAGGALARCGATAMIDLSDGLGGDAKRLSESSGVGITIDASALPLAEGVAEVAAALDRDPVELAASGGEDYELLAALPPEQLAEARTAVVEAEGIALTKIGEVVSGEKVEIRLPGGSVLEPAGFDQLT